MKDNLTGQLCDNCNSHIISYRNKKGKMIYECSYCGEKPDEIFHIDLEEDENYE